MLGRQVTIADVHRDLVQSGHQVSYAMVCVHARRHHSADAVMAKMLRIARDTYREFELSMRKGPLDCTELEEHSK
jgi:hypothetical protein